MSLLHFWGTQRPTKRRKTSDHESSSDGNLSEKPPPSPNPSAIEAMDTLLKEEGDLYIPSSQTELESSLPAIKTDETAIQAYETSHTEQGDGTEPGLHVRLRDGVWQRGKSSIYVDAFNLALETVLEEESHLFNAAELEVLTQYKQLSYESQYLYEPRSSKHGKLNTLVNDD